MNRSQNNGHSNIHRSEEKYLYAEKTIFNKRKKSYVRIAVVIFALIIALLLLYFAARALFRVDGYTVEGNYRYTSDEIIHACGIDRGRFMFTFSASDVEAHIEKECPYVKKAILTRDYPSNLNIYIEEHTPQYYTCAVGKYIVFSSELKVLEVSDENSWDSLIYFELPQISVALEGEVIELSASINIEYITEFISALSKYDSDREIKRVSLTESYSIKLYCGEGYEVLLGKSSEMELKLNTLSKMLDSDRLKENPRAKIDLTNPKEPSFVPIFDE